MANDKMMVDAGRFEHAHNLVSQMLIAMLQAKSMNVDLNPTWFTDKARETCQALSESRGEDPAVRVAVDIANAKPETAYAVMSGRTSEGIWEVLSYWGSRDQADKAHAAIQKMEV